MTLTNAIKKVEKATGCKMQIEYGQTYSVSFNGQKLRFSKNGRSEYITCIHTARIGQEACTLTDYFPGVYHNNITQALKSIGAI